MSFRSAWICGVARAACRALGGRKLDGGAGTDTLSYAGVRGSIRSPELAALGHALAGGSDPAHGELLSYLFFAPELARALLELGARDARAYLAAAHEDGIWSI